MVNIDDVTVETRAALTLGTGDPRSGKALFLGYQWSVKIPLGEQHHFISIPINWPVERGGEVHILPRFQTVCTAPPDSMWESLRVNEGDPPESEKRALVQAQEPEEFEPLLAELDGLGLAGAEGLTPNMELVLYPVPEDVLAPFQAILESGLTKHGWKPHISFAGEYYFPCPTSLGPLLPAFTLGVKRSGIEGYEEGDRVIVPAYRKEKTETELILPGGDPEWKAIKPAMTPKGLQVLLGAFKLCSESGGKQGFELDLNRLLDLLGYPRRNDGSHHSGNRKRVMEALNALGTARFHSVSKRRGGPKKKTLLEINGPVLEMGGDPVLSLAPTIHSGFGTEYTPMPDAFLALDANKNPHAILLYAYLALQWRIGWHQHHGIIQQPLKQILEGSGLDKIEHWSRRRYEEFVRDSVLGSLVWLKSRKQFWIGDYAIRDRPGGLGEYILTVPVAEDHPLRQNMMN